MVKGTIFSSSSVRRKGWRSSRWSVPYSISFPPFIGTLSSQTSRNQTASMVDANVEDSDSSHDNNMPTQVQRQHFYALYTFHSTRSNQHHHEDKSSKSTAGSGTKKGDGLGDEAEEEEEDGDIEELSLSIVATDLNAGVETELRKCLVQRLSKGVDCVGSGNVVSLTSSENSEFPSVCYYCLWKSDSNPSATCGAPLLPPSATTQTSSTGDYLVCFLFGEEDSLEHFRVDLDDYSGGVLQYLDAEMSKKDEKDKLSRIDTCVKNYLQAWPVVAMDYLCRCLDVLNTNVHHLIYCALIGAHLEINGGTEQFQKDVRKFVRSCTLEGFENLQQSNVMSNSCDSWQTLDIQPNIVPGPTDKGTNKVGHEGNGHISLTLEPGDKFHFDPSTSCRFCKEWADKMVNSDRHNAVYLKVTIDSYKLQCIQHINTLNRLLKQADNDHYALYRAYVFLKNSGYGNVLLKYCQLLDLQPNDLDALRALEEFIEENNDMMNSSLS